MLFFLLSCCFILFDLWSFQFCLCVWLRRSCVILSASNCKSNVGQTQSFAFLFPTCVCSREAEALLLRKRCFWEQEWEFWVTVLEPNMLLLAQPYQFTWESCWLPQTIWFWWLQCLRSRKLGLSIYSLLLEKGEREAPPRQGTYTSWLRHII